MMRSLIAIAALVASVSTSAGSLDGKSIVCTKEFPASLAGEVRGFKFQNGEVYGNGVFERDLLFRTDVIGETVKDRTYDETRSEVEWWWGSFGLSDGGLRSQGWTLDRKDLTLSYTVRDAMTETAGIRSLSMYGCEVFDTVDAYNERLSEIRYEKQKQLDADLTDNKI